MNPVLLIDKKKEGKKLSRSEFKYLISGIVSGAIPDYQISALMMAIYFNGLDDDELFDLTDLMLHSGRTIDFELPMIWDKHSTGGVGDKISIILAPILASFGIKVPMISGRSLGHTGGTIDKLESIPNFQAEQPIDRLRGFLQNHGFFIISQSKEIAPADRVLYGIRDVTGTVDSIPLIVASILSKKFAVGIDGLMLDIKCGKGAFMNSLERARELSDRVRSMGCRFGKKVRSVITNMDQPLGRMVGNSLEIIESVEFLKGDYAPDVKELVFKMVEVILSENSITADIDKGIRSGRPLELLRSFIVTQGGDGNVIDDYSRLPVSKCRYELRSEKSGWVLDIDALKVGQLMVELGGGRRRTADCVDHRIGFEFFKKVGDRVSRDEVMGVVYLADKDQKEIVRKNNFIEITEEPTSSGSIIYELAV